MKYVMKNDLMEYQCRCPSCVPVITLNDLVDAIETFEKSFDEVEGTTSVSF